MTTKLIIFNEKHKKNYLLLSAPSRLLIYKHDICYVRGQSSVPSSVEKNNHYFVKILYICKN